MKMKTISKFIFLFLSALIITSCLDVHYKVKLNTDGSGTIEERFLMGKEIVEMLGSFASMGDSSETEGFNLFDEEELKKEAMNMGEGVTYVSGKEIKDEGAEGYLAVYKFDDINKISIKQDPSEKVDVPGMTSDETEEKEEFTFNFVKGNPAVLSIKMPKEEEEQVEPEEDAEFEASDDSSSLNMNDEFIELFKSLRIKVDIEFDGEIVETDASFIDDNVVTLFEMNFEELFNRPERLEELKKINPKSLNETSELLKDIPGFKFEIKEKITVKFE
jgi:hypothetical protein